MSTQDCEGNGYTLLDETLSIHSRELTFFRRTLRLLGFWHPIDASFIERLVYPLLINMLLLCILLLEAYFIIIHCLDHNSNFRAITILGASATISRYTWAWIMHTLVVKYFKERNLERKLFDIEINDKVRTEFKNMVRNLNWIVAAAISQTVLIFAFSLVLFHPVQWHNNNGQARGGNNNTTISLGFTKFYRAVTFLISISNLYMVSILLCLTWLMYLLCKTSRIRLLQLKHEYMSWNQQAEQAIFRHYTFYTKQVQSNCKALSLLFISHNIPMIIMTPQHIYLCLEVHRNKGAIALAIFLYYCFMFLIFWIVPLYFAESLRREEDKFQAEINNFCQQYLELNYTDKEVKYDCLAMGIFRSRTEVEKLTSYLKGRKSGFLFGFYSFQLQLSMLSLYIGLLMLIIRIISG